MLLDRADEIVEALGESFGIHPLIDARLHERRLAQDGSVAATLAKLFRLCMAVPAADAVRALAPAKLDVLVTTGLASLDGEIVQPRARVGPYEGLLVASDPPLGPQPPDFVTGPSPSARRVDRLTIRGSVGSALDLGTGPGIQALLAARHADKVMAIDISERALAFARFNAAFNGIESIHFRQGDWFEPAAGERFDLVVTNPPYVVSPDSAWLYRDSNLPGDAIARKLVRESPAYLEEGGFAHVMGNWIHGRDEDWRGPVEECVAGSGCDALFLKYGTLDPFAYAGRWNMLEAVAGSEPFLGAADRWLDYYRREGIEAISEVMVVLRRRSGGRNWVRAIEVPGSPTGPAGDHVARLFEARDRRAELADDQAVLAARFALAQGVRLTRRAKGPRLAETEAKADVEDGIGFAVGVPPALADGFTSLDGSRPLQELTGRDRATIAAARRLFALGILDLP